MNKPVQLASKNTCYFRARYCFALAVDLPLGSRERRDLCSLFEEFLELEERDFAPIRCDECKRKWPKGVLIGGK